MIGFFLLSCLFAPNILFSFLVFILEEFRKKQKKSNLSDNLQYFMETGYKATDSDTIKVKNYHMLVTTLLLNICNILIIIGF